MSDSDFSDILPYRPHRRKKIENSDEDVRRHVNSALIDHKLMPDYEMYVGENLTSWHLSSIRIIDSVEVQQLNNPRPFVDIWKSLPKIRKLHKSVHENHPTNGSRHWCVRIKSSVDEEKDVRYFTLSHPENHKRFKKSIADAIAQNVVLLME